MTYNVKINGETVKTIFPIKDQSLLDERLDESSITVYSTAENYAPLSLVEITVTQHDTAHGTQHIVRHILRYVASDNAIAVIGLMKGEPGLEEQVYKHDLSLIEITKELEGIACQSITFTQPRDKSRYEIQPAITDTPSSVAPLEPDPFKRAFSGLDPFATGIYNLYDVNTITLSVRSMWNGYTNMLKQWANRGLATVTPTLLEAGTKIEVNGTEVAGASATVTATLLAANTARYVFAYTLGVERAATSPYTINRTAELVFHFAKTDYKIKSTTVTDVIERCLDLAEPIYGEQTARFTLDAEDAAKYAKIEAPEFTMQEGTLREQLQEVGRYIHAEPYVYISGEQKYIKYKPLGITEKQTAPGGLSFQALARNIDDYLTEVKTYAKNLVDSENVISDPGINEDAFRSLRSEEVNARITSDNGVAQTLFPIYKVIKVMAAVIADDGTYAIEPTDITQYIYEETVYNSQLSTYAGTESKENAIYYKIGERNIRGLFFKAPNIATQALQYYAISNIIGLASSVETQGTAENKIVGKEPRLAFQIAYVPMISTSILHGKNKREPTHFVKQYNQSESIIDAKAYGENLKGAAARMGNVEQERTYYLPSPEDVPEVGKMLGGYAISGVAAEYMPTYTKCTLSLTKDFNRISQYIGIKSHRRLYEVSERNVYERHVLLTAQLTAGGLSVFPPYRVERSFMALVAAAISGQYSVTPTIAYTRFKTDDGETIAEVESPVTITAAGNANVFTFAMKDNYSAGVESVKQTGAGLSGYWTQDVPYSNFFGRAYFCDIAVTPSQVLASSPFSIPKTDVDLDDLVSNQRMLTVTDYKLRKDNREALTFSLEVMYNTDRDDVIIGSALARRVAHPTATNMKVYGIVNPSVVGKFTEKIHGIAGLVASGDLIDLGGTVTVYEDAGQVKFGVMYAPSAVQGWVIVTAQTTVTETISNGDGSFVEVTKENGGDVILASLKHYSASSDIFSGITIRQTAL